MFHTNFDFIVEKAKAANARKRIAIAGADAENILIGAFLAEEEGFASLILLGNEEKITKMLKDLALYQRDYKIVNVPDDQNVTQVAIDMINAGEADVLMRGNEETREFLMTILDKKNNLYEKDATLAHLAMVKVPEYKRIMTISDVSVIVEPNMSQKRSIVKNMVNTLEEFGYENPNIGLLSLIEVPAFHMRDTVEADTIVKEHKSHPIANCNLVGPIAYDLVVSKEAARLKNYDCDCCGEFDGIVVPNLLSGNLLLKAMLIHSRAASLGMITGAKVPIAITSRSEGREQAYLSVAACVALCK